MFVIVNPNWKSASQTKAATHAPAVAAFLAANPTMRMVSLAELKAGLPAIADDLNRAVVNQIAKLLAIETESPGEE